VQIAGFSVMGWFARVSLPIPVFAGIFWQNWFGTGFSLYHFQTASIFASRRFGRFQAGLPLLWRETMKRTDLRVGEHYRMRVSGKVTTVKLLEIEDREGILARDGLGYAFRPYTRYLCKNLSTGRECSARSARKFQSPDAVEVFSTADHNDAVMDRLEALRAKTARVRKELATMRG
jgi:hypothetical protein